PFYTACVGLLELSSLLLLVQINRVLLRLVAMLPDETLRAETKLFTWLNSSMLALVLLGASVYMGLNQFGVLPHVLGNFIELVDMQGPWVGLFMILMPLAMTMALMWKIKEVIFASLFQADH